MNRGAYRKVVAWLVLLAWSFHAWAAAVGIVYGLPHVHIDASAYEMAASDHPHDDHPHDDHPHDDHPLDDEDQPPHDHPHHSHPHRNHDTSGHDDRRPDRFVAHRHDHPALADHWHGPDGADVVFVATDPADADDAGTRLARRAASSLLDAVPLPTTRWGPPAAPLRFAAAPAEPLKSRNPPPLERPPRY